MNYSEEDKKAIQMVKNQKENVDEALIAMEIPENYMGEEIEQDYLEWQKNAEIILNLIETQKAEIEDLKDFNRKLQATKDRLDKYDKENTLQLEKKNNIINLMAEQLTTPINDKKWVIEYYTKLAEEEK